MNSKIGRLLREEGGFTLSEMLVTIMIMIMVFFALHSIFDMSIRVFSFGNDKTEAVANARLGLERMEREVRAAYPYDRAGVGGTVNNTIIAGGVANPSASITFGNDLNGNRQITPDTATEQITYSLSGSTLQRNAQPLVEFVKANGLTFQYLDRDGNPTIAEADIRRVRIKLEVEVKRGPQAGAQLLTTDIAIRNRP